MKQTILDKPSLTDLINNLRRFSDEGALDPNVRLLAEQVSLHARTQQERIEAIFDFIHDTFPYTGDPVGDELFIHPRLFARDYLAGQVRLGDCDDFAMLTVSMCRSVGIPARIVLIDSPDESGNYDGQVDHAFAEALCSELGWIALDTSTKGMPLGWGIPTSVRITI